MDMLPVPFLERDSYLLSQKKKKKKRLYKCCIVKEYKRQHFCLNYKLKKKIVRFYMRCYFELQGKYVTSRNLRDRLYRELERNLAMKVEDGETADTFIVSGRGTLHITILIENM